NRFKRVFKSQIKIGFSIYDYIPEDQLEGFKKRLQKVFCGESLGLEKSLVSSSGEKLWYELNYEPIFRAENQVVGASLVSFDITANKKIEQTVKNVFQLSNDMLCLFDFSGKFLEANPAFYENLGYSPGGLDNLQIVELISIENSSDFLKIWETVINTGKIVKDIELEFLKADGNTICLNWSFKPDTDSDRVFAVARDLSRERKMEILLKKEEKRARVLFETELDGIIIIGYDDFLIKEFNSLCEKILKIENAAEFRKTKIVNYLYQADVEGFIRFLNEINDAADFSPAGNFRFVTPAGEIVWIRIKGRRLGDSETDREILLAFQDLASFKLPLKDIISRNQVYKNLFDSFRDIIYRADKNGNILMLSPSAETITGYTLEELLGKDIRKLYQNPNDRKKLLEALVAQGGVSNYEIQFRKKNGEDLWGLVNTYYYKDEEGNVQGVEGIVRDITDYRKNLNALKESEKRYRALIETLPEAIIEIDLQGRIQLVNKAFTMMTGYEAGEVWGDSVFGLIFCDEYKNLEEFLEKISGPKSETATLKTYITNKNGKKININLNWAYQHKETGETLGMVLILSPTLNEICFDLRTLSASSK
ncbi:MAG: PAS domain S-box protein, partial [Vulcanimicrobiota bacterium]